MQRLYVQAHQPQSVLNADSSFVAAAFFAFAVIVAFAEVAVIRRTARREEDNWLGQTRAPQRKTTKAGALVALPTRA